MAGQKLPFFVMIGPSNMNGTGSVLTDYPAADLARVIGLPPFPSTTPALVTVPGIKMWQAKMPFAANTVLPIHDVPAVDQLESEGAAFAATNVGQWVFIDANTTGHANLRRISLQPAANRIVVNTSWSPTLAADGNFRLLTGSRSVGSPDTVVTGTSDSGTTLTMTDAARIEATDVFAGKWIKFTSGANNGAIRLISSFDPGTDTITFTPATTVAVSTEGYEIVDRTIVRGTSDAPATASPTTLFDAALTQADNFWNGCTLAITSGPDAGQTRTISDFIAATDTIVFSPAVTTAIGAGITYEIRQNATVISKDTTSPEFTPADVGRWVSIGSSGAKRKIAAINSAGGPSAFNLITLDNPLFVVPGVGDAIMVLDGATAADTLANFAQGAAFRDLQWFLDASPVFFTGFDYCNYTQNGPGGPTSTAATTIVNSTPELMTQMRYRFKDTVYCFQLGIDAAQAAPQFVGTGLQTVTFGWRHDNTHLDYHPSNANGLMGVVLKGIASAQALAVAQGDTLDPQGIFFIGLLENDTLDEQKLEHLGENVALIRDTIRTALGSQRVPCVILGCSPSSVILPDHDEDADRVSANRQALQLKLDDPWTGFIPTPNPLFIKHSDQIHYLPAGHVAIAQALAEEWDEVKRRATAASRRAAELPTLASLRTRVKRRYERSAVGNDATNAQVDTFINDSLREIYNTLGDNAWFLRLVEEIDALAAFPNTVELPRSVRRFLKLELKSCPGQSLVVKGLAYTDEGRTQVTLHTCATGPFICHFIQDPKELVVDTDVALVPSEYQELVVMLTCKRLTENAGNGTLAIYYASETERLWRMLKREALRYDRMRQGQLQGTGAYDSQRNSGWPGWQENL